MKNVLPLLFILCFHLALGQQEADKWYFGQFAGLDFSPGIPVAVYGGAIATNEGCASISDAAGNLLFYTDGVTVWNRNHQPMPNGTGLMGGISSTQSSICIPLPGSTNIYYLFTVDEIGGPNGFRYSIVDMSLQGGNGDVDNLNKNIPVLNNVTEKLTAMKISPGTDYWIAVHEWGSNAFYNYKLTSAGLQTTPVISHTGIAHNNSVIQNTYGAMKYSPCGDKIAAAIGYQDTIEVFDFDQNTGSISNSITIPIGFHVYGIEYSRNGELLYVSTYDPLGTLVQYDLSSGVPATIIFSKVILSSTPDIYALQIGNDGRIYVCRSFSPWLGVINSPNVPGTGCNYVDSGVDLDPLFNGVSSALGLPGFIQSAFRLEIECDPTSIAEEFPEPELFIYPNPASDYFTVKSGDVVNGTLEIYNVLGERILSENLYPEISTFRCKEFPSGIFHVRVTCAETIYNGKLFRE